MYFGKQPGVIGDPKPDRPIKSKNKTKFKKKPTGEGLIFSLIATTREHKSFVSGHRINELTASCFAHVLPKAKNKFPLFKLNPKNIVLLTPDEHFLWDFGIREDLKKRTEWQKMFDLEEELIEEYKNKLK